MEAADSCKSSFTLDLYLNFIFELRYISRLSWDLTGVRALSIRSRLMCKIDVLSYTWRHCGGD